MAANIVGPVAQVPAGGGSAALNITAAQAIKTLPGTLTGLWVVAPGSASGALTIVDGSGAAYSSTEAYSIGQAVTNGGVLYWCTAATTGNAPPNGTYWSTSPPASQIIMTVPVADLAIGQQLFNGFWPCASGIIVAAVPGGSPIISISFL